MAGAYTPGLTVASDVVIRRVRRLPIKGEVLVEVGQSVSPATPVARALLPGNLQTVRLADRLGIEARDVAPLLKVSAGDPVRKGQVLAEGKKLFGLFKAPSVESEYEGTFEAFSEVTGNALVREPSIPVEVDAYISGSVAEVLPGEGAAIETRAAMIQGIFGVGGEREGVLRVAVTGPAETLDAEHVHDDDRGRILIGGAGITAAAIRRAGAVGAAGLVAGGIKDSDLIEYLGYDIGVAITGSEDIPLTILVTEGFGFLAMATRTFELLRSLEGQAASLDGATQIRAGVIRPEVIVPHPAGSPAAATSNGASAGELSPGTPIRIIREPHFGKLGVVTELPPALVTLESGTTVRVLRARLAAGPGAAGEEVTVPRANVEIIAAAV